MKPPAPLTMKANDISKKVSKNLPKTAQLSQLPTGCLQYGTLMKYMLLLKTGLQNEAHLRN